MRDGLKKGVCYKQDVHVSLREYGKFGPIARIKAKKQENTPVMDSCNIPFVGTEWGCHETKRLLTSLIPIILMKYYSDRNERRILL